MMRIIWLLICSAVLTTAYSQSVDKTLVSNGGTPMGDSQINISFSIGEPVIGSINNDLMLDQGFWAGSLIVESLPPEEGTGSIVIYPNPVEETLNIFTNDERVVGLTLFAVNGQRVRKERVTASQREHRINVSHLSKGTYILRLFIEGNNEEKLFKIIKE